MLNERERAFPIGKKCLRYPKQKVLKYLRLYS